MRDIRHWISTSWLLLLVQQQLLCLRAQRRFDLQTFGGETASCNYGLVP